MVQRSCISSSEHRKRSLCRFLLYAGVMATVPLLLLLCAYVAIDPFKVLRWHDDPFADRLGLNKGMLSVQAYEKGLSSGRKYDSFIMGSSVSCAYLSEEWVRYLPYGSSPLHMDSSGQTVSTLRKYLEYLESSGVKICRCLCLQLLKEAEYGICSLSTINILWDSPITATFLRCWYMSLQDVVRRLPMSQYSVCSPYAMIGRLTRRVCLSGT